MSTMIHIQALVTVFLIYSFVVYSMELDLPSNNKKYSIKNVNDVVLMPWREINRSYDQLSCKQQEALEKKLSHSWIFNVGRLPHEIGYAIVKKMVNDDDEMAEAFFNTPVLQAFIMLREWCDLQQHCPLILGNKKYSAIELFVKSHEDRCKLIALANPSIMQQLMGRDSLNFTRQEYDEIVQIFPDDQIAVNVLPTNFGYLACCSKWKVFNMPKPTVCLAWSGIQFCIMGILLMVPVSARRPIVYADVAVTGAGILALTGYAASKFRQHVMQQATPVNGAGNNV